MHYKHLSIEERELLQKLWWERRSIRAIAAALKRSPSSISRELRRNPQSQNRMYAPRLAHQRALAKRKSRGRTERLKNEEIREYVVKHLTFGWSPEQISKRIGKTGFGTISHEAIYQYVYAQIHRNGWGILKAGKKDLRLCLRRHQKRRGIQGFRRSQHISRPWYRSIDERPTIVAKRSRVGDWESDTVESFNHKPGINTLVERKTGYVFITRLPSRSPKATAAVIKERLETLPPHARATVTFDNGVENQSWSLTEQQLGIRAYFAHPHHSWERGTNENTNGLIREFFPKRTDFDAVPDEDIRLVEYLLNNRPRKRLGWKTPLEALTFGLELCDEVGTRT